jgi:hypothetical protein
MRQEVFAEELGPVEKNVDALSTPSRRVSSSSGGKFFRDPGIRYNNLLINTLPEIPSWWPSQSAFSGPLGGLGVFAHLLGSAIRAEKRAKFCSAKDLPAVARARNPRAAPIEQPVV